MRQPTKDQLKDQLALAADEIIRLRRRNGVLLITAADLLVEDRIDRPYRDDDPPLMWFWLAGVVVGAAMLIVAGLL